MALLWCLCGGLLSNMSIWGSYILWQKKEQMPNHTFGFMFIFFFSFLLWFRFCVYCPDLMSFLRDTTLRKTVFFCFNCYTNLDNFLRYFTLVSVIFANTLCSFLPVIFTFNDDNRSICVLVHEVAGLNLSLDLPKHWVITHKNTHSLWSCGPPFICRRGCHYSAAALCAISFEINESVSFVRSPNLAAKQTVHHV